MILRRQSKPGSLFSGSWRDPYGVSVVPPATHSPLQNPRIPLTAIREAVKSYYDSVVSVKETDSSKLPLHVNQTLDAVLEDSALTLCCDGHIRDG